MPTRLSRLLPALFAVGSALAAEPPVITVTKDNTRITQSCRVVIPAGTVIQDTDNNGVIQITRPDITVEFADGSILRGNLPSQTPDQFAGVGITIADVDGVVIKNAHVQGFKVGLLAAKADRLYIDGGEFKNNWRQHLRSTPAAEDSSDWLWPHANDQHEWRGNYGAAVCIESSQSIRVRGVAVRDTQNGIILDRVSESQVWDNDCSFLSGWGIAMWRSSRNMISRNACDFCIRGHSEGIYNRGQDSAGFLVFEQCSANTFIENSATHGGDCFFGFAGKEAIGEVKPPDGRTIEYGKLGCNDNILIDNDFSYAAAHGIEMTFSSRNRFIHNRLVENAICGVWGGYSNDTIIANNHFIGNGGMSYGLECGGVNIEHGSRNRIINNEFTNNRCGVHLWWDDDKGLLEMPGVRAAGADVIDNVIAANHFEISDQHPFAGPREKDSPLIGVRLRDVGNFHVKGTRYLDNVIALTSPRAREFDITPDVGLMKDGKYEPVYVEPQKPIGDTTPNGARPNLRGRTNIIMGEWGPWDHASPLVVPVTRSGAKHEFDVFGVGQSKLEVLCDGANATTTELADSPPRQRITVIAKDNAPVASYSLRLAAKDFSWSTRGTIIGATWECAAFSWSADPREDLEKWRSDRLLIPQAAITAASIDFAFGRRGPRGLPQFAQVKDIAPGPDKFGMVCVSTFDLPKGVWRFTTLSDDGVRVLVKRVVDHHVISTTVIENWTWHGPTQDSGLYDQKAEGEVSVYVEYFQLDGHAVLKLDITPEV